MSQPIHIAVDAMGGDTGPRATLPAALRALKRFPYLSITLFGDAELADQLPAEFEERLACVATTQTIEMHDKPAQVLRNKQDSSMWRAIELVKDHKADACVSAGNTGALMAIGRFLLKTFPGVDRPAICKPVPTAGGHCYVLDLGANVNCTSEQLLQFALMGSVLASEIDRCEAPRVALLNIGEEDIKGNEQVKLAANLLNDNDALNYVGFIEGDGLYQGLADVVVCDGFVGNVALKVSEGVAGLIGQWANETFRTGLYGRLVGQIARPLLRKWHSQLDPSRYNGASFLGLQGTLIKSHGGADANGFYHALSIACEQAEKQVPQRINKVFEGLNL